MLAYERVETWLRALPKLRIGLLGDLVLDRYLEIPPNETEISIETGLEAYQVHAVRNAPGALGTVISNLVALGVGQCIPITAIGDDGHGYDVLRELKRLSVEDRYVVRSADRLTPTYTKPLRFDASGNVTELNRLDLRTRAPLSRAINDALCEFLCDVFHNTDGLIVLDQVPEENCGVVNSDVRGVLTELCASYGHKLVLIDSRRRLGSFLHGTLKGNESEVLAAAGQAGLNGSGVQRAALSLAARAQRAVYATRGDQGILVAQPDGAVDELPAMAVEGPIDIVGAGDSATAAIACALLAGASHREAAELANLVASITIRQIGCTGTATPQQILSLVSRSPG